MQKDIKSLLDLGKNLDQKTITADEVKSSSLLTYQNSSIIMGTGFWQIKNATFSNCVFYMTQVSDLRFTNCTFVECNFFRVNFTDVEFHSCSIENCVFNKPKFKNTYLDPQTITFDFNKWKIEASNINTWLFQKLESNYKEMHQDKFAMYAHIAFRRYLRWQWIRDALTEAHRLKIKSWFRFFIDILYDKSMGYGYGLGNALVTTIILFGIGAIVLNQWWEAFCITPNVQHLEKISLIQKLYFLVVTSSTVGYGDLSPKTTYGMLFVVVIILFSIIWTATITAIILKRLVK
jgi:hypothetical protein